MRTVYLGTSEFAADVLRVLAASPHAPQLVVTRPDRPRGRGRKLASPPVLDVARELAIETDQPESVNDDAARERIAGAEPDVVVVCAFGALIKEPLLSAHPMLNVHPSLLPRWRGAAPIERAIMAGDERTGVCIMRLTEGLDSGPVCLSAEEPIGAQDTYGTVAARLAPLGGSLLVQALDTAPPFVEQDESGATYAEKITAEDRLLAPTGPRPTSRASSARCPRTSVRRSPDPTASAWECGRRPRGRRRPAIRRPGSSAWTGGTGAGRYSGVLRAPWS